MVKGPLFLLTRGRMEGCHRRSFRDEGLGLRGISGGEVTGWNGSNARAEWKENTRRIKKISARKVE